MKICPGKHHGDVEKLIDDDSKYCSICQGKKKAKKEEIIKKIKDFGKILCGVVVSVMFIKSNNDKDKS